MCWKSLRILTTGLGRTSEDFSLGSPVQQLAQNQASYWHSWLPAWQPWGRTNSQGLLLKVILRQFAVTLTKHSQRRSLSISRRFSLKRVTWFEQPSFYWARSLKRLWNLPLRRINIMLLKFVTLEHGKTPTMENLRKQLRFQWKKINGTM